MIRDLSIRVAALVCAVLPLPGFCGTPCGPSPDKADGVVISTGDLVRAAGNVELGYTFTASGMQPAGLTAGGPAFVWIVRSASMPDLAKSGGGGTGLEVGKVYGWTTNSKRAVQTDAMKNLQYICDFDTGMADGSLLDLFLKPEPAKASMGELLDAAEDGDLPAVSAQLARKANVNAKAGAGGPTALMLASRNGHLEVVRALLSARANVNMKNTQGETAMILATLNGHLDVVRALIAAKADVNARTIGGYTALIFAARTGRPDIAQALLEAGAAANVKTKDGTSAVAMASRWQHPDLADLLRRHGGRE